MKLILQIMALSSGLFIASACGFPQGASVEAMPEAAGSPQASGVETVYTELTPTSTSMSNMVVYPEAEGDTRLMRNQSEESIEANSSLLSVWAGPDGLFIRHIYSK